MEYNSDLTTTTVVWWRFFWRYTVCFSAIILVVGISVNFCGRANPSYIYKVTLLSGLFANVLGTLCSMFFCVNRKFRNSPLVLQGKNTNTSLTGILWIWFIFFWRFFFLAIAIASILGYMLPICFQYAGFDPLKALKFSKYLGNISTLPASFLAFISMVCRKEKHQTLKIAFLE